MGRGVSQQKTLVESQEPISSCQRQQSCGFLVRFRALADKTQFAGHASWCVHHGEDHECDFLAGDFNSLLGPAEPDAVLEKDLTFLQPAKSECRQSKNAFLSNPDCSTRRHRKAW